MLSSSDIVPLLISSIPEKPREREREREREEEEEEEITYSNSMYVSLWMPCKVDDLLLDNTILSYIDDWVVEFVLCVK